MDIPAGGPTGRPRIASEVHAKFTSQFKSLYESIAARGANFRSELPVLATGPEAGAYGALPVGLGPSEARSPLTGATGRIIPAGEPPLGSELDPLALTLAEPGVGVPLVGGALPPAAVPEGTSGVPAGSVWESLLIGEVVRRVSWGGDRRRGLARIELAGALEGTCILVEGEGREVAVEIALAPGAEPGDLCERLAARFARRGLTVRSLTVR
jgi:hypothetical protein